MSNYSIHDSFSNIRCILFEIGLTNNDNQYNISGILFIPLITGKERGLSLEQDSQELTQGAASGAHPVHPGVILREAFLVPTGLTASALAIALQVPAPRVNEIVRERRGITADTALRLARYFGNAPEYWMRLQDAYDLAVSRIGLGEALQRIQPRPGVTDVG
jgi:addiction module HigA family antidote